MHIRSVGRFAVRCLSLVLLFAPLALSQTAPEVEKGIKLFGSYQGGGIDNVSLSNGGLVLQSPLLSYAQRGDLAYPVVLMYSSKSYALYQPPCLPPSKPSQCIHQFIFGEPPDGSPESAGNSVTLGFEGFPTVNLVDTSTGFSLNGNPQDINSYSALMQDGAQHQLVNTDSGKAAIDASGWVTNNRGLTDSQGAINGALDRNGNQITATQDTLGRAFTAAPGPVTPAGTPPASTASLGQCPALGYSNQPATFAYSWSLPSTNGGSLALILCYASVYVRTNFFAGVDPTHYQEVNQSFTMLQSVVLPDNSHWAFQYDAADPNNTASFAYGELTQVAFPAGGSISYTYTGWGGCSSGFSRAVRTRTVNASSTDDVSRTWQYNLAGIGANHSLQNVVTAPDLNDTVHTFTGLGGICSLYETQVDYYQGSAASGTLLKTVKTDYQFTPNPYDSKAISTGRLDMAQSVTNVLPNRVTTILPNGLVSKVETDFDAALAYHGPLDGIQHNDQTCSLSGVDNTPICTYTAPTTMPVTNYTASYGRPIARREFDWGQSAPGPLLRQTLTTYQWQTNSAYLAANLMNLPATVKVLDANSNLCAETDYAYDESAPASSGVSVHLTAAPAGTVRGNLTTVTHKLSNTPCAANAAWTNVSSHTAYFDTGEVKSSTDPLGHTTSHLYDLAYQGALSTQSCSPATAGGTVAHCVSGTYDFSTGLLTSLTNENATQQASGNTQGDPAHTSTFTYDSFLRLTQALAPTDPANGNLQASSTLIYPATAVFPETVTRKRSITSALSDSATSYFDGLGRAYQSDHVTPGGTAEVLTTYDAVGRVATVTNPYYVGSDHATDPTYGVTSNIYDALGRVITTVPQDGTATSNNVTTDYSNLPTITVTDQAGKLRRSRSDALGRLVEVDEPPASGIVQVNNYATLQTNGNFALYSPSNQALWSTGTSGTSLGPMEVLDNGNLVLFQFRWQVGTYRAPSGATSPYDACRVGDSLFVGQTLTEGQCLESATGMTFALMTHGDLQIYDRQLAQLTWTAGTYGHTGGYAAMQSDGRLAIYDANNNLLWASATSGTGASNVATLQTDGRLIIYSAVWSANTSQGQSSGSIAHPSCDIGNGIGTSGTLGTGSCAVSSNGRYQLLLQSDGNLVLSNRSVSPAQTLWSTNTGLTLLSPGVALSTYYTYDTLGNLLCVEQHGNATTGTGCSAAPSSDATSPWRVRRFTYDSLSRLLTAKNPESGTITYLYDADGELLQKTSPAPNQTGTATTTFTFCYDALHRMLAKGYVNSPNPPQQCTTTPPWLPNPTVVNTYDQAINAKGKLISMTDQAGTASYSYDILGRLTTETRTLTGANGAPISMTVSYDYNLDGSLYKLHYPSGAVVTYAPWQSGSVAVSVPGSAVDTANNINYATGAGGPGTYASYGADGSLTGFVSGKTAAFAGITNAFGYNKRLQPLSMSAISPTQTVFSIGYDFHLGAGNNGNVFGITNSKDTTHGRDQSFTYDALNRLTSAQNAGTNCATMVLQNKTEYWGNSYSYDAWGNLINKTVTKCGAESLTVSADAHNWIHATAPDYLYDAAGNMTFNATPPTQTYSYDQENRLTGAAGYAYTYDGDGNRVRKSNGNLAANGTLYWEMTPGVVAETDLAGTTKSEYIFFDGERVARRDGVNGAGGVFYYFSDHLKTASVITDSAGMIKAESDYYPWGGELQFVNNDSNDYKFTGKKRDLETGLDYFGARYYSNGLGRFITPDWAAKAAAVPYAVFADPQSLNLYSYVRNIPTTRYDPDGHCSGDDCSNVTVTVTKDSEPHMIENLPLGNRYYSGVGTTTTVKFTDSEGAPLAKMSVKESNTKGSGTLAQNPTTATTSKQGTITDNVMKAGSESKPVDFKSGNDPLGRTSENLKEYVTSTPMEETTTQTLTFNPGNASCQATYTSTLSNLGEEGTVVPFNNSQGTNFQLTTTQPVVKPVEPKKEQQ
jgi:RHS repeat-associated protein